MKCFDKGGGGEEAPQWYLRAKANKVKEGVLPQTQPLSAGKWLI